VPLVPEEPEVPAEPLEPLLPEVPELPLSPLSPVLAKVKIQSSPSENGLLEDESTGDTIILKNPLSSEIELIVNNIKVPVLNSLLTLTCPFIVDVESSIVLR